MPETEEVTMIKRMDPPDCGCTDCITGYSKPLDFASDEELQLLKVGVIYNATGDDSLQVDLDAELKMMIIMRKDLKMNRGKLVAQGSHAVQKAVNDYKTHDWTQEWEGGIFTKIVCRVESLDEMNELYRQARDANIPCSYIIDAGRTAFNGVETPTCIAIGPAPVHVLKPITGNLRLYA